MWIYLNQQPNKTREPRLINIFSYGTSDSMKPQISYFEQGKRESNTNIYRITFTGSQGSANNTNTLDTSYEIELTSQKWNHLFFNYSSNSVDLFINGILERTFYISENVPQYSPMDRITIGDDNGLDGAICNITYYTSQQTKFQITNLYNLLMNKNPPINNII